MSIESLGKSMSGAVDPSDGVLSLGALLNPTGERAKSFAQQRKLQETKTKADQEDQEIRSFMSAMGLGEQVQGRGKATQQAAGEFLADRGGERKAKEIKAAGGGGLQGALDAGKAALREQQIAGVSAEQIEAGEARREFQASVVPEGTDPTEFAALSPEAREEVRQSSAIAGAQQHFAQETARIKGQQNRKTARVRANNDPAGSFYQDLAGIAARLEPTFETTTSINEDGTIKESIVQTSPGGIAAVAARVGMTEAEINEGIARSLAGPQRGRKGKGKNRVKIAPRDLQVYASVKKISRTMRKDGVPPGRATMAAMYTEMGPERMLALPRADEFTDGSNEQMAQAIVDRLGIPADLIKSGLIQDLPKSELNALIEMMMSQLGVGGDDDRHALRSVVIQKLQQARL